MGCAVKRGQMLVKAVQLLHENGLLVVVLPLACVDNSRYFTRAHFRTLLAALNVEIVEEHATAKLHFIMARRLGAPDSSAYALQFPKKLLHPGSVRNNFHIIL